MAKRRSNKKDIEQYKHKDKQRVNNPPVGLVTPETDKDAGKKTYQYDPHLDPQLQWAGKAEHTSFEVPTVSLHVHERIDTRSVIEKVKKSNGYGQQLSLFEQDKSPLREAIEFYKHKNNWTNRLIAGDSLLVMNSLLEKEGMGGQVQMIYIDPPYGIKYGSNFQPFVNKRDVKDGKDEDLTAEPEMIKAFRDTWELRIHSYLTYLRDRLLVARELLNASGSVFVQISDENVHHVREMMDEVFGVGNFISLIVFKKASSATTKFLSNTSDFIIWYSKGKVNCKYRQLYLNKIGDDATGFGTYKNIELKDGSTRTIMEEELKSRIFPKGSRLFRLDPLISQSGGNNARFSVKLKGKVYELKKDYWKTNQKGFENLIKANRIVSMESVLRYKRYIDDFSVYELTHSWDDVLGAMNKNYVVETNPKVVQRCILMCTDPGDLVFDPTCGSGTTAYVAEQWGRRWITCDTSRVSIALAKQRLMTANFDYYQLAHPHEGVGSGFTYKTVPHITLKSIANNEPPADETLYDQPYVDTKRTRISGPFTVEAVPAPVAKPIDDLENNLTEDNIDSSIARMGETLRQSEWRSELLKSGVRGKGGQRLEFSRVELLAGTRFVHAEAETREDKPQRVLISFGPEFAPIEQRQVELAIEEAGLLKPKPGIILFVANQFDSEAAKDIDETKWPGVTLLRVQMNADLFTDDLKKKRSGNESFWLVGQPDVQVKEITKGKEKGKVLVEVLGFDYYNTKTGNVVSGGANNIAMWMIDEDYDGRSLFPKQIFFPMAGEKDAWAKLARNLKAEIDEEKIEAFRGTVSLPFKPGKQVAVKIIDDRGIESLRIIKI